MLYLSIAPLKFFLLSGKPIMTSLEQIRDRLLS